MAYGANLLENGTSGQGWLTLDLSRAGAQAAGARVTVTIADQRTTQVALYGGSYLAGMPLELYFGLGAATSVDDVAILTVTLRPSFHRIIERDPGALAPARAALRTWLDVHQVPEGIVEELILASSEALANAVEHAHPTPEVSIEFDGWIDGARVVVQTRSGSRPRQWPADHADPDGRGGGRPRG